MNFEGKFNYQQWFVIYFFKKEKIWNVEDILQRE